MTEQQTGISAETGVEAADDATAAPGRFVGLRTVSLLTFVSRILGLVRDMAMAALFGNGVVLDAFTVALRIPNLSRRLFGEGALTAAFLPIFVRELERAGRESAWKLTSAVLNLLAAVLCLVVLIGELALWGISRMLPPGGEAQLLVGLTAVMFPYLLLICLAAQISAVLHALRHFAAPACLPILLNVVWITAVLVVAPRFADPIQQITIVAASVVVGGVLQLAALLPTLFRFGFRYSLGWRNVGSQLREIIAAMLPVVIGLSITQINTLSDSVIAWGFSLPEAAETTAAGSLQFLQPGTASALFFGQRMYQFPLGMIGVALGTVLFPLLARHAERRRFDLLRQDLDLGLRLMILVGLPASVGLVLLAEPITALLFQRGAFDAEDVRQTVQMISAYAVGVWAFCGLLIVHRGYYAVGDRQTPLRIGLLAVLLNLCLNFGLIWPLHGAGLALATSISAIVQFVAATWVFQNHIGRLEWSGLIGFLTRTAAATLVMAVVCWLIQTVLAGGPAERSRTILVAVPLVVSVIVYFGMTRLLGLQELRLLFRRQSHDPSDNKSTDDSI